jgi:hypothetical protein
VSIIRSFKMAFDWATTRFSGINWVIL